MQLSFSIRGFGATIALIALTTTAEGATLVVDTTNDAIDSSGDCSLREAVIAANTNAAVDGCAAGEPGTTAIDTIQLGAGTYSLSITGTDETWQAGTGPDPYDVVDTPDPAVGDLDLLDAVSIVGAGSALTTIDWGGANGDRIFQVAAVGTDDVGVQLLGITLTGGYVANTVVNPGDPQDQQWTLRRLGGAIAVGPGATMKLFGTSGMDEGNGGPPDTHTSGGDPSLELDDVTMVLNTSEGDAGALSSAGSGLVASNVLFQDNVCDGNGGALYHDGDLTVTDSAFVDNVAEGGGAMHGRLLHGLELLRLDGLQPGGSGHLWSERSDRPGEHLAGDRCDR